MRVKLAILPVAISEDFTTTTLALTFASEESSVLIGGSADVDVMSNTIVLSDELCSELEFHKIDEQEVILGIRNRKSGSDIYVISQESLPKEKTSELIEIKIMGNLFHWKGYADTGNDNAVPDFKKMAKAVKGDILQRGYHHMEELEKYLSFVISKIHDYQMSEKRNDIWEAMYEYSYQSDSVELNEAMATLRDNDLIDFAVKECVHYIVEDINNRFSSTLKEIA